MAEGRNRQLISGLLAIAFGLLFTLSTGKDTTLMVMDKWSAFLEIPEKPAIYLRSAYDLFREWTIEKDRLLSSLKGMEIENDRLFIALHMNDALSTKLKIDQSIGVARVDLRLPVSWWKKIRLDKGGLDGVEIGDPIMQGRFLIGRIFRITGERSWADLVTSSSLLVPVVVRQTRDVGVLVGDDHGGVWLRYIPSGNFVLEGMDLDTALVGENIPPGLPVGKVSSETRTGDQGEVEYRVVHGGDMTRLYGVTVLDISGGF